MEFFGLELIKGLGRFFAHPLTYIIPFAMFMIGYFRVKRERATFHTRVYSALFDVTAPLLPGLLTGFLLSFLVIATGLTIPFAFLMLVGMIMFLFILLGRIRWLSPSYTIGLAIILALLLPGVESGYGWMDSFFMELGQGDYRPALVLLTLLMIAEGLLIWRNGKHHTSPMVVKSSRGKWIGAHRLQRIWFIPALIFVPGGAVEPFQWWPVLSIGESGLTLFLIPFAIGAKYTMFHTLPKNAVKQTGLIVVILALFIGAGAVSAFYYPDFIMYTAVTGVVAREVITFWMKRKERAKTPLFKLQQRGIRILGILPESPAEKMGLKPGEVIMKVNGQVVNNESEFYDALQKNSAYCKVEVCDQQGEIRHAQSTVYDNEHHELGVLLVKERNLQEIITKEA
ncbi:PDZ domain-containing protein [Alteribacillus sp. YIM 98480]|uniref:PDZ domain-containing protein n=1 Tax=Alteribacillus sp. YIM 98480 TaxID=2606599 RepID=UPI00131CC50C|nr:PDZ domain-containing protein [Alteribacillus sp. YIM 98480]